jgi:DNA replication protein DnaC
MMTQETVRKMNALKLYGMAHAFTSQIEAPSTSHLSFEERLGLLIDHEVSFRDDRRLQRLLSSAKLREPACIEDIDYQARRGLDRSTMSSLALCNWIRAGVNLAITGKTGVGKTWIACALGNQACRHGMTVKFERIPMLLEDLVVARADHTYRKRLSALAKFDLLILDDLGLTPLSTEARSDLLEVAEARSGLKATIITSQLPVKKWHEYLSGGNPTVADAIMDRLLGKGQRIELTGESLRTGGNTKEAPASLPT